MTYEEKKIKLIEELEAENKRLPNRDAFGNVNNFSDSYEVIKYLKTGRLPINEDNDLLHQVLNNFNELCEDYGIE